MSWRDQLRDGSFRGVPFKVEGQMRTEVGRRGQLHEYPLRDTPYAEDLGRRRRAYNVECLVLGPDYMAARDALITALEQKGPGTLVHPYYGTVSAAVFDPAQVEESTREGGMARFRIPFVESGEKVQPAATTDTVATVNTQAANTQSTLVNSFSNGQYNASGVASWVSNSAMSDLGDLTTQLQSLRDGIPGIPDSVTAFNGLLQGFSRWRCSVTDAVLALGGHSSMQERFSQYIVKAQQMGDDTLSGSNAASPSGNAMDGVVNRYRPTVILAEDQANSAGCKLRAAWQRTVAAAKAQSIIYTVKGWKANGKMWQPNALVPVRDPFLGINETRLISQVDFFLDAGGERTKLTVTGRHAFDPIKVPQPNLFGGLF